MVVLEVAEILPAVPLEPPPKRAIAPLTHAPRVAPPSRDQNAEVPHCPVPSWMPVVIAVSHRRITVPLATKLYIGIYI